MERSAADSLGPIRFSDLRAHVMRDAVIVVAESLDLLAVADAVARDDKAALRAWIEGGLVTKPSREALEHWERDPGDIGVAVVVQPFVLFQARCD